MVSDNKREQFYAEKVGYISKLIHELGGISDEQYTSIHIKLKECKNEIELRALANMDMQLEYAEYISKNLGAISEQTGLSLSELSQQFIATQSPIDDIENNIIFESDEDMVSVGDSGQGVAADSSGQTDQPDQPDQTEPYQNDLEPDEIGQDDDDSEDTDEESSMAEAFNIYQLLLNTSTGTEIEIADQDDDADDDTDDEAYVSSASTNQIPTNVPDIELTDEIDNDLFGALITETEDDEADGNGDSELAETEPEIEFSGDDFLIPEDFSDEADPLDINILDDDDDDTEDAGYNPTSEPSSPWADDEIDINEDDLEDDGGDMGDIENGTGDATDDDDIDLDLDLDELESDDGDISEIENDAWDDQSDIADIDLDLDELEDDDGDISEIENGTGDEPDGDDDIDLDLDELEDDDGDSGEIINGTGDDDELDDGIDINEDELEEDEDGEGAPGAGAEPATKPKPAPSQPVKAPPKPDLTPKTVFQTGQSTKTDALKKQKTQEMFNHLNKITVQADKLGNSAIKISRDTQHRINELKKQAEMQRQIDQLQSELAKVQQANIGQAEKPVGGVGMGVGVGTGTEPAKPKQPSTETKPTNPTNPTNPTKPIKPTRSMFDLPDDNDILDY